MLFCNQAGSGTISLFSINPRNPTDITQIGKPIPTQGDFPNSVAFNSKGTQVCVLNAGGSSNGVKYVESLQFGLILY